MSAQNDAASLVVAIPSKGRLQENANAFFARAGLPVAQAGGARGYRGSIAGLPGVEVAFLSASEIAQELARGAVHFGVTGLDLVHETVNAPEKSLEMLCPLGFGHADVVVAAPEAWIDVAGMADVEDVAAHFQRRHGRPLRVATKYVALTRAFFARHGIVDYRIVESLGATEGAPAAGTAELIVDITTTGATLAANGLKIVETILKSEAHLVASLTAPWNGGQQALARRLLGRIAAEEEARLSRRVLVAVPAGARPAISAVLATEPEVRRLGEDDAGLTLLARRGRVADLADALIAAGARDVAVASMDMLFRAQNPLFDRLSARLG